MKKKHNLLILFMVVALIAAFIYMQKSKDSEVKTDIIPAIKASVAGVDLAYKEEYAVYEKTKSPYTKTLTTVVWYENTESNRSFFAGGKNSPQEPPVTMTLDIYDNPNNLPPKELLKGDVPYMFVQGEGAPLSFAGKDALLYSWDGLYKGKSIMVNHNRLTYVFSVTSISPVDPILKDFDLLLSSVVFK